MLDGIEIFLFKSLLRTVYDGIAPCNLQRTGLKETGTFTTVVDLYTVELCTKDP